MKKTYDISKRTLALFLSLMMVMSLCVVSVSAAFEIGVPTPTTGIILSDDFESYATRADSLRTNGGPYSSGGGSWPMTVDGNKVWATQVGGAASSLWYAHNQADAAEINSGKLSLSATIEVASGYTGTAALANGRYPSAYIGIWKKTTETTSALLTFANTSSSDTSQGGALTMKTSYHVTESEVSGNTAITFSADVPHEVALVINYDEGKTYFYLDGVKIGEEAGATTLAVGDEFGLLADAVTDSNYPADGSGNRPYIYVDDLRIERMGAFTAKASYVGEKQVDVTFSSAAKAVSGFGLSSISLQDVSGNTIPVSSYAFNNARDTLTLNLDQDLVSGQGYKLDLGQGQFYSIGNPETVYNTPSGGLSFVVSLTEMVVLNQNFDTVTFPTQAGTADVDWMSTSVSTGTENQYSDMSDWRFYSDSRDYGYASAATVNGSPALCVKTWMPYSWPQSAQSVVLPFSQEVKGGVLTVEFDAEFISDYGNRFAFGLRDTTATVGGYNPWQTWGNATYLGGLTYWSGAATKSLIMNSSDKPNMLPDGYLYYNTAESSGYKPGGGTWGDHSSVVSNSFTISNDTASLGTNMKTWKYVIDLDNETYSFYLDDVHQKTLDYIPGGSAGTYDAFVASVVGPSTDTGYGLSTNDMSIYLDNVKVTHKYNAPVLSGAMLTDYNDTDITLADGLTDVSTGTMKAVLDFDIPMDASSVNSEVIVTSTGDAVNYTKETNRGRVTINFPEGLQANTTYTISTGNVTSANGHAVIQPQLFSFTTDAGEDAIGNPTIKVDGAPISSLADITADSTVSAEVVFVNTAAAGTPRGGVLYLAAYKDDELLGAKTASAAAAAGVHSAKVSADATDDNFYGADKIRAFLFNNTTDLKPMMQSVDFPGSYASASFSSYSEFFDAEVKEGISVARLGSNTRPTLETQGSRTGWRLDASSGAGAYIAVDLSGSFTDGLDTDETIQIEVDYYDDSYGGFAVIYQDHADEMQGSYRQMTKTEEWRTASFTLYDASFANDFHDFDFVIAASDSAFRGAYPYMKTIMGTSPVDILIGAVRVSKVKDGISPYDITVDTGKPGNVFVYGTYGTNMTFNIDYTDPKGKHDSGTAVYTVKDYNGVTKWTATQDFTGGTDTLNIPYADLPLYGIYTLEIDVTGDGVDQSKVVDFSSTLQGALNLRYGTNLHYDWRGYTQQDVKDQIDLVYAAGIGITRSKINWNEIQTEIGGEYTIPENVENIFFANQYLDELGMENLCIINQQNWAYIGESSPYHWMTTQEQRDAWAEFCAWVVDEEQLGQYTKYFAIGNEFNLQGPGGWHPYDNYESNHNATNYTYYVDLVKAAYPAIKNANTNAIVINGEIGRFEDEWTEACYELGIADYTDVFSFHAYDTMTGPEYYANNKSALNPDGTTWHRISPWAAAQEWYKLVTAKQNTTTGAYNRPWMTETGVTSKMDSIVDNISSNSATDSQQAMWLVRSYALLGYEVDKLFHYAFTSNNTDYFDYENNFGIVRAHDYRTPYAAKPAYVAIAALNHFTGSADFGPVAPTYIGEEAEYRARGYLLNYASSQNYPDGVIMAWKGDHAGEKQATMSILGATNLNVYDMYGNWVATIANGSDYTLTPQPVYVVKAN